MKRLLVILMLVPFAATAQDFKVIPKAAVEYNVGGDPRLMTLGGTIKLDENGVAEDNSVVIGYLMTKIGIEFRWRNLGLSFDNITYMLDNFRRMSFAPTQSNYSVGLHYQFFNKYRVYVRHECYHPVTLTYPDQVLGGVHIMGYSGGATVIGISYNY